MGCRSIAPPFLTSTLVGEWSASRSSLSIPGKPLRYEFYSWMGPKATLNLVESRKSLACRESNPGFPTSIPSLHQINYPLYQSSICHEVRLILMPAVVLQYTSSEMGATDRTFKHELRGEVVLEGKLI